MNLSYCVFLIPLITWRLGVNEYDLAKPRTFAKKFSFTKLAENAVGIWQYCRNGI